MSIEKSPSITDIADLGGLEPEPSQSYLESLDMLDNIVRECMHVSRGYGGISSPHGRHFYASVLFTAMIGRGLSLLILAPHTPWASKQVEHWDYSSMTGITRTLIELRVAFYYLCTEECSEDEWQFRWNLFNLHDCTSRIRMFDALSEVDHIEAFMEQAGSFKEQANYFREQADDLRQRLTSNPFFETLPENRRKKLLHGQTAYLFPLEEIAERAGIEKPIFRWLYVLFSTHVHALPMSFYRLGGDYPERGRGLPSEAEEGYSSLCLTLSGTLLVYTRDELHRLFEGLKPSAEEDCAVISEPEPPPALKIGEEHLLEFSDAITMRVRRTEEEIYTTTVIDRRTGDEVLERADREDGSVELLYFDPYFWTVSIDGGPATEATLERAIDARHAFRVDPNARELHFKTQ